jgi:hypothetical protein
MATRNSTPRQARARTPEKVTAQLATEIRPHIFYADASDLGFPVGEIPLRLETDLGNGQAFVFEGTSDGVATFKQIAGCVVLRVLND